MRSSLSVVVRMFSLFSVLAAGLLSLGSTAIAADFTVYGDSLAAGWENWSWNTTASLSGTSPVHSGTNSLAVTYAAAWAGLYLATNSPLTGSSFDTLQFWIHGGSQGGQRVRMMLSDGSYTLLDPGVVIPVAAGAWTRVQIALADLGNPPQIGGIVWQDTSGSAQPTFYLDDIAFTSQGIVPPPPLPPGTGPDLTIDTRAGRRLISEDIYGMNFAEEKLAAELRLPVRRWGGNSTTRYNWQTSMINVGSDWYFENIPESTVNISNLPHGSATDQFVEQDRRTGTRTLLTVPLIGWTPKGTSPRSHPYDCSFRVSRYGTQQGTDYWDPDCGNGIRPDGSEITGNNPADTSTPIGPDFVTAWIDHLTRKYGSAFAGGVAYYDLDNEPMLWNYTHRDVHPLPADYDELRDRTYQYAAAIKAADPSARTLGPVLWGWCAYFYSALDGCGIGADYQTHGSTPFVAWYLQQMKAYEQQHGVRILDYLDLHYYPQADDVSLAGAGAASTQALRLRSTRSLWDPAYVDESWISDTAPGGVAVHLIPRMHEWVNVNYPATKLAITEYNWGALDHLNGALAQADLLGIFGREGLDLATLWGPPTAAQPGAFAFRIYRNYDRAGHGFGDVSVQATSSDQGALAVYAAERSADNALTVVVINKTPNGLTSTISLSGFVTAKAAAVYRYSGASLSAIERLADQPVAASGFSATFPGNSITLLEMMPNETPPPPPVTVTVSPTTATVPAGTTMQFTAAVSGAADSSVKWLVNDVAGGNPTVGTITAAGLYTAPATLPSSANVTVKVVANADTTKFATASVIVTPPSYVAVKLLSPNGGEVLATGGTVAVTWGAPPTATSFALSYSLNNGASWLSVVSGKVSGTSYQWKVPVLTENKSTCLMRVTGYDARGRKVGADQSDAPFTIEVMRVAAPNEGETLSSGTPYAIAWKTNALKKAAAKTVLSYTTNGGTTWTTIATLTGNPGTFNWTPQVTQEKTGCKVRVVLKARDGSVVASDTSDGFFTMDPAPLP